MDLDLDAIEARANAATLPFEIPTPWTLEYDDYEKTRRVHATLAWLDAARSDIPALVAEVRRLRVEIVLLEEALESVRARRPIKPEGNW